MFGASGATCPASAPWGWEGFGDSRVTLNHVPILWRRRGLGCPMLLPFFAASLGPQAQLALTPHCARLPTDRRGVLSPLVLSLVPRIILQLTFSLQGCLHRICLSTNHSSAWIPLSVLLCQEKADFYGRQPTLFLPSMCLGTVCHRTGCARDTECSRWPPNLLSWVAWRKIVGS